MKKRVLPVIPKTQILLGQIYPELLKLRDSELHGNAGTLDLFYKGFRILWTNDELPPEKKFKTEIGTGEWENPNQYSSGADAGGGTLAW